MFNAMRPVILFTAILALPTASSNEEVKGCRFYIGEVIALISSNAESLSSVISLNEGVVVELDSHHHGISKIINSLETIRYRSKDPDLARLGLGFARFTEKTNRANAEFMTSTVRILRNIHASMEGDVRILGKIRDQDCAS